MIELARTIRERHNVSVKRPVGVGAAELLSPDSQSGQLAHAVGTPYAQLPVRVPLPTHNCLSDCITAPAHSLINQPTAALQVREVVVVHPDQGFLDDLTGELEPARLGCDRSCEHLFGSALRQGRNHVHAVSISAFTIGIAFPCPSAGELREYVAEEVNVRALTPCADPLKYCR